MVPLIPTPRAVDIAITSRCNLRCRYCSHFNSADDVGRDLPAADWLTFFEELGACAVMEVCLSGGEPFLREDLRQLIEGIVRHRMRFSLLSNGTLIADEMAVFLKSSRRCSFVQVSLDGGAPEPHDAARGPGNFHRAVAGLRSLQRHGVACAVRVTIHKHNVHHLEEIAGLLLDELHLPAFSTNAAGYLGLCRLKPQDIQLGVAERSLAMETLLALSRKYPGRIQAAAGPLAEARMWLEMERARREQRPAPSGRGHLEGCGGVFSKLAVRADGVMVPCNQLAHIELGRINRDPVKEIWQNHPALLRLRNRRAAPLTEFDFCKNCDYAPYCTGNCPALAYTLTGDEEHPSPDACLKRFLEAGGRLPEEEQRSEVRSQRSEVMG